MRFRTGSLYVLSAAAYCLLLTYCYQNFSFSGQIAGSTNTVEAVVSLGYCGDGIVGDNEDCDGSNLGGLSCGDIHGYNNGNLVCDQSCSFDTTGCGFATPTNTQTISPTMSVRPTSASIISEGLRVTNKPLPTEKLLALVNTESTKELGPIPTLKDEENSGLLSPTTTVSQQGFIDKTNVENNNNKIVIKEEENEPLSVQKVSIIAIVMMAIAGISKLVTSPIINNLPEIIGLILKWLRF